MDTKQFTYRLGDHLAEGFELFKPLSRRDLHFEIIGVQKHLFGDFGKIIQLSSHPIRSFYLNANYWQDDIAQLVDRMDYFVVYVSSITESVLWEIDLLERKQRTHHATVVFDERAIANKELQAHLQKFAQTSLPDKVRWAKSTDGAPALSAEELRDRLAKEFLVVSPGEFFANIDVQKNRIAEASGPGGPGACEAPLEFRFYPALDAGGLKEIRDFDDMLEDLIRERVSSKSIRTYPGS